MKPSSASRRARARAPGGIGNIGPGLDVLGCAITGAHDEVLAEWCDQPGVTVLDAGHADLPRDAGAHTAAIAASSVLARAHAAGHALASPGIALTVTKGLPLAGGQAGSAASAVAGAVAANALLGMELDPRDLLACCLEAESRVAGRHLDNIAAVLFGGIVLVRSVDPIDVIRLPVPNDLHLVLAHPAQRLSTADSRRALPASVARDVTTHQIAQVAAMVAACYANDVVLFARALDDRIAEPARAPLLPGFSEAKSAALHAGALASSISGAGPTAFAIVRDRETGARVGDAMRAAYERAGVACTTRIADVDERGTTLEVA